MHGKILKQKLLDLADPAPSFSLADNSGQPALPALCGRPGQSGQCTRTQSPLGMLSPSALAGLAQAEGLSLRDVEVFALEQGFLPERYKRNLSSLSLSDQLLVRKSRVFLVGLGGLGGHCLDFLLRLGVGGILAVDGDCFEPSNWNRQLLSPVSATMGVAGVSKVAAARAYAARVNPAVDFEGLEEFMGHERMYELMCQSRKPERPFSLVVDALGGLEHRMQLQKAADKASLPLVTAGLAGWSGYVARVLPGGANPAQFMEAHHSPDSSASPDAIPSEDLLGTPVLTVAFAASLQIKLALESLLGDNKEQDQDQQTDSAAAKTILFDLSTHTVETVQL